MAGVPITVLLYHYTAIQWLVHRPLMGGLSIALRFWWAHKGSITVTDDTYSVSPQGHILPYSLSGFTSRVYSAERCQQPSEWAILSRIKCLSQWLWGCGILSFCTVMIHELCDRMTSWRSFPTLWRKCKWYLVKLVSIYIVVHLCYVLYARRRRDAWIGQLWGVTDWSSTRLLHWKQTGTTWYRAASAGTLDQELGFSMQPPLWLLNILSHTGRSVTSIYYITFHTSV